MKNRMAAPGKYWLLVSKLNQERSESIRRLSGKGDTAEGGGGDF